MLKQLFYFHLLFLLFSLPVTIGQDCPLVFTSDMEYGHFPDEAVQMFASNDYFYVLNGTPFLVNLNHFCQSEDVPALSF